MVVISTFFVFVTQDCDISRPNVSKTIGIPKLEITKRAFCSRTKINDWFGRSEKSDSFRRKAARNGIEASADKEMALSETLELANLYQDSNIDRVEDAFSSLERFKRSLKKPVRAVPGQNTEDANDKIEKDGADFEDFVTVILSSDDDAECEDDITNAERKSKCRVEIGSLTGDAFVNSHRDASLESGAPNVNGEADSNALRSGRSSINEVSVYFHNRLQLEALIENGDSKIDVIKSSPSVSGKNVRLSIGNDSTHSQNDAPLEPEALIENGDSKKDVIKSSPIALGKNGRSLTGDVCTDFQNDGRSQQEVLVENGDSNSRGSGKSGSLTRQVPVDSQKD